MPCAVCLRVFVRLHERVRQPLPATSVICVEPITSFESLCKYSKVPTHKACSSAHRYLKDQSKQMGGSATAELSRFAKQYPKEYRCHLRDMGVGEKGTRRGEAYRAVARGLCQEIVAFYRDFEQQKTFYFGERAFIAWYCREFGYTKEEAVRRWKNESRDPDQIRRSKTREGELLLPVKGHLATVKERGFENKEPTAKNDDRPPSPPRGASRARGRRSETASPDRRVRLRTKTSSVSDRHHAAPSTTSHDAVERRRRTPVSRSRSPRSPQSRRNNSETGSVRSASAVPQPVPDAERESHPPLCWWTRRSGFQAMSSPLDEEGGDIWQRIGQTEAAEATGC